MNISAEVDARKVNLILDKLSSRSRDMRPALTAIGEDMKIFIKDSIELQRDPVTGDRWKKRRPLSMLSRVGGAGGKTLFDTGRLLRSFASSKPHVTNLAVSIGSNLPYARIHQVGGIIKAKGGGVLTIPMSVEAKRAGSARRFIEQKAQKGERPFFMKTRKGRLLLAYYKGRKGVRSSIKTKRERKASPGVLTFAYYCPKSVTIPQRRYLGFGPWEKKQVLIRLHDFLSKDITHGL